MVPPGSQPTVAKIFVNKCNIGFDDVDSSEPAQILMLNPLDLAKGARIPLRAVRFTAVRSLHVSCVLRSSKSPRPSEFSRACVGLHDSFAVDFLR
jgi:hypothetical protein